jgi:hypothetical protein
MKYIVVFFAISCLGLAQVSWTNGDPNGPFWSLSNNWSSGSAPNSSSTDIIIGVQPTADFIVVNDGNKSVRAITFQNSLTAPIQITPDLAEQLNVSGSISNLSSYTHTFGVVVNFSNNTNWSGSFNFSERVNFGTSQIAVSGSHIFTGTDITFEITNTTTYGRLSGSGSTNFTGVTINIGGAYTGAAGNSFDFTTTNFTGATIGSLPTLTEGLAWNTSQFINQGVLTVQAIPEPTTIAALLSISALCMAAYRRRSREITA